MVNLFFYNTSHLLSWCKVCAKILCSLRGVVESDNFSFAAFLITPGPFTPFSSSLHVSRFISPFLSLSSFPPSLSQYPPSRPLRLPLLKQLLFPPVNPILIKTGILRRTLSKGGPRCCRLTSFSSWAQFSSFIYNGKPLCFFFSFIVFLERSNAEEWAEEGKEVKPFLGQRSNTRFFL